MLTPKATVLLPNVCCYGHWVISFSTDFCGIIPHPMCMF